MVTVGLRPLRLPDEAQKLASSAFSRLLYVKIPKLLCPQVKVVLYWESVYNSLVRGIDEMRKTL